MAEATLEKQEAQEMERAERTRNRRVFIPRVDIYETNDSVVMMVDMPGVSQEGVDIMLEKNILTINGYTDDSRPQNMGLAYREYREGDYERTFALSEEVDRQGIEATMKNGVLKLVLPKAEEMKARRIEVKSAG
jgi:HSP20 family molecular chaperone IbpA